MAVHQETFSLVTRGSGFIDVTDRVESIATRSGITIGLVHVFCRHTSCSLVIMENADPSARRDLQAWMDRLVPENDPHFTHTLEGADDMPSHIKMALTRTSETVPWAKGALGLGTWQGIFLWEHRNQSHRRELIVTVQGD